MAWLMLIFLGIAALAVALVIGTALIVFLHARIVPLALSILGGLLLSAAMAGGTGPTAVSTVVAAALLYALSSGWRKSRRTAVRARQAYDIDAAPVGAAPVSRRFKPGRVAARTPERDETLGTAFAALAENADWARSRVAVAQESCRLFLRAADRDPFDNAAADLAIRIRKRIPEHIDTALGNCAQATASERRALLEAIVFTTEKVGAEADRERERLMANATSTLDVQRRHLTRDKDSFLSD